MGWLEGIAMNETDLLEAAIICAVFMLAAIILLASVRYLEKHS